MPIYDAPDVPGPLALLQADEHLKNSKQKLVTVAEEVCNGGNPKRAKELNEALTYHFRQLNGFRVATLDALARHQTNVYYYEMIMKNIADVAMIMERHAKILESQGGMIDTLIRGMKGR